MRRAKFLTISLVFVLAVLVLPSFQPVQAKQSGPWDFLAYLQTEVGQQIDVWADPPPEISASERSFVFHGWGFSSNRTAWDGTQFIGLYVPCDIRLFIDGTEIELEKRHFVDNTYPFGVRETWHWFIYWIIFEADHFTPGEYEWRVEYSWRDGLLVGETTLTVT